jgi:hypothetical protein
MREKIKRFNKKGYIDTKSVSPFSQWSRLRLNTLYDRTLLT